MNTRIQTDGRPPTPFARRCRCLLPVLLPVLLLVTPEAWSQPPTITAPTLDDANAPEVSPGVNIRLRSGTGTRILHRQWRRNGLDIPGATSAYLNLNNVQPADAGDYTVVASNTDGETVSPRLTLTVNPTFTAVPVPFGAGLCLGDLVDVNGDGWLDVLGTWNPAQPTFAVMLNARDGTFVRGWQERLPGEFTLGYRTYADYDNDGDPDLFAGNDVDTTTRAYRNVGGGNFERLNDLPGTTTFADLWTDLDGDGFLDVFRTHANGCVIHLNLGGEPPFTQVRPAVADNALPGWNLARFGSAGSAAWGDVDDDGRIDVFVSSGNGRSGQLFRNHGGGMFLAVADFPSLTMTAVNPEWVDVDGDADLDLFINPYPGSHLTVVRNLGNSVFVTMTATELGDLGSETNPNSAGTAWGDFDNDGDLDLYLKLSTFADATDTGGRLYVNQGNGSFRRFAAGSPVTAVRNLNYVWYLASWGDYDHDGFLDLLGSQHGTTSSFVYRNNLPQTGNGNHWLEVQCIGRVSNRDAVGAKVRVKATLKGESRWQLRQVIRPPAGGTLITHFGLADAPKVDVLRVEWPSGIVQEFTDIPVNQSLVLGEPPRLKPAGPTSIDIACWKGMSFGVEASTDLQRWTPVGTVMNTDGTARFNDAVPVHGACRFYRVAER